MTDLTFDTSKLGTAEHDLTYTMIDRQPLLMDVYYPGSGGPWPGMVFVHGGGWVEGDKAPMAMVPTDAGFLVVSINYRMYPAYRFPAMIEDVKTAIRHLRAKSSLYNLDPERIALVGHSAGGHLVALAGLAGESAGWDIGGFPDQSSQVQAVVPMSAPANLSSSFPEEVVNLVSGVFGADQLASASPVQYAHPGAPPFLIVHGDKDDVVPVEQAHLLYDALKKAGSPVEELILKNGGHGFEPVSGPVSPSLDEMFARVLEFLTAHLGN